MAHVFKLNGDYDCTVTDIENLEQLCEEIVVEEMQTKLKETLGRDIRVKVSWVYDGYRVFVMDRLTEKEAEDFVISLDPLKQIDTCSLFWEFYENINCTGILLGYDYTHYLRMLDNDHSFIVLANKGLEEFMRRLLLKYAFINPNLEMWYGKDRAYEKKVLGEKLKGIEFKAEVNFKAEREWILGRMHIGQRKEARNAFDDYWRKQHEKKK